MITPEEKYGPLPDMDWLPINKLIIDNSYQCSINSNMSARNIDKIANNFAWSKFSPLIVNDNGNNTYSVIDGQHRLEAVKQIKEINTVPCYIIPNQTVAQQASDFTEINTNRVCVNFFDLYKARKAALDPDVLRLEDFLQKHDLVVSNNGASPTNPNIILGYSLFIKMLKNNREEDLAYAVSIIKEAYPLLAGRFRADLVTFLCNMHQNYGNKFNRQAIINALKGFTTPNILSVKSKNSYSLDRSISCQKHYERILINEYNKQFKLLKGIK